MKQSDLEILLQEGEGTTLEFKESLSASFAREVVALANTLGGRILLGVRDDGTVAGIRDSNLLRGRIQDIARNCDPAIQLIVEKVGTVIVVTVRESGTKPVQCSDGFFWRQGATSQKLSRDEIRDFFRTEGAIRFDRSLCPKFRYPQDFDRDKYRAWLALSTISGRPRTEDVLVNIEAAERSGGRLIFRNAGVLFFAKDVRRFFNQAYITCLLAKGIDKVHLLDRKDFADGVVADIEESLRFIERNTRTAYRIERLQRDEIPEYPVAALREAITNAVMHRDWFNEGANVFVEIYDDRIEVSSPGGLPKGMRPADLGRKSVRRNALIADLLHRISFIEKAGTGIKRMREAAREQGCPEPAFTEDGFFTAVFFPDPEVRTQIVAPPEEATAEVTPEVTTEVTVPGKYRGSTGEVPGKYRGSTGEVTAEVLQLLAAMEGEMKRREIQAALGLKHEDHFREVYLLPALELESIEMTLPDKPRSSKQGYRITPRGKKILKKHLEDNI